MIKKGLSAIIKLMAFVLIVLLLIYLFKMCRDFGYSVFQDKSKDVPETPTVVEAVVTIKEGDSAFKIGEELEKKGIVSDKYSFAVAIRCMEGYESIVPGDYTVNSSMKPSELLNKFIKGTEEANP
ncbi:MAG: endolytic transglycosylase MltG [Eubacteriales bacterium]|nr:endolytic transglycosylase MltG [Eubacteriales bacterium]